MKNRLLLGLILSLSLFSICIKAEAKGDETIAEGIYAGDIDLNDMTAAQARRAVLSYVDSIGNSELTLVTVDNRTVIVPASEFKVSWANPEIIDEAVGLGKDGNVIECYKSLVDLKNSNIVYDIELSVDDSAIRNYLETQVSVYDIPAVNATMKRVDGVFNITESTTGCMLDIDPSITMISDKLTNNWDGMPAELTLVTVADEPKGKAEDLVKISDVIGTFSTSFSTSNEARSANVRNGCSLINGTVVFPGDEFSVLETITPFTEQNGYYMAGAYLNGKVVDSLGGGICQVSSTLYNAVLRAELEVTERSSHSMIVTYVSASSDAAISESGGKDFKFVNNTEYPIYIEGYTTPEKKICFNIYGVENRPSDRTLSFESVVLETDVPENEVIYTDASQPIGYVSVQSAHIGYKAQLWKIVTEGGVETSREQVNGSVYNKSPRSATVGVATENPDALAAITAAINSGSIDEVRAVAAAYAGQ